MNKMVITHEEYMLFIKHLHKITGNWTKAADVYFEAQKIINKRRLESFKGKKREEQVA